MDVTIYHNPARGTSRNTLALIRNAGVEPTVIEYLKTPPTRAVLQELISSAGLAVREAIRQKGTPYAELGLDDLTLKPASASTCWTDGLVAARSRSRAKTSSNMQRRSCGFTTKL
ncbi:hypothetical protein [Aminobacter anthyllidis]|uniref:hypothetical protein n=1 Tax=Aminobacter anthyllidis TaxID=1035067 RepID=UPI001FE307CB|nr:hypothetical protein [Aminobacter anthyllidis]